ncbi:cytochrome P450 [Sinorhizobium mexicanum]|uniref:cytochrome P450 n=1 Tax=Sinorhizobium mexicanum TaxID=375549 RepID=UPI0015DE51A4|nr:cytochrome P450 [Sinorhizobium mexicanum]MBP1884303.1 fatty-acid peroxygenase [Sinorhizobium mexicanum]
MKPIPQTSSLDSTLALFREGYAFISNHCDELGTDIFQSRLMLRSVVCMRGEEAARLFYGADDVTRVGSMPWTVLRLLQDKDSVQQLDGAAHLRRKAMFIDVTMDDAAVASLVERFRQHWLVHFDRRAGACDLRDAANLILTKASADWIGIAPRWRHDDVKLARQLGRMIDRTGRPGPAAWFALASRRRIERWLATIVAAVRDGSLEVPQGCALKQIGLDYRDADGERLSPQVAAVELLNLLRPIAAISRWIVFLALALARNPQWPERFGHGHDDEIEAFVEEVRRLYPFFPFVGARLTRRHVWQGYSLREGSWLLLDLYGTTHDPRLFASPMNFSAERKLSWRERDFRFIPHGGGRPESSHRCPGEKITVEILKETVKLLCGFLPLRIAPVNAEVPLSAIPASPVPSVRITSRSSA